MRTLTLLLLPVLLLACATGKAVRTGKTYPARPSDWPISVYAGSGAPPQVVMVVQSGRPSGRPIGRIQVGGPGTIRWGELVNRARVEARKIGGDEVLITKGDVYLKWIEGRVYRRGDD